jgi:hypothetical protein
MPPSVEALGNSAQPPDLERFGQFGSNTKVNAGYYQLTIRRLRSLTGPTGGEGAGGCTFEVL